MDPKMKRHQIGLDIGGNPVYTYEHQKRDAFPMKTAWIATGFAIIAAIIQPTAPQWLFMALILASVAVTGVGLYMSQRRWRHQILVEKMNAAFGKPKE
jgi:accessory gene regulator protein AgrB